MPACPKHPKFNIKTGVYFRAANPDKPSDWIPKSETKRAKYYQISTGGDLDEMAGVMGEAQMIHSNESSADSAFVSAARCPACLSETTDPTVQQILASTGYMCQLMINPINAAKVPFVFHVAGDGIGAAETEALVLLPNGVSLLDYFQGYITPGYVQSMK